MRSTTSVIDRSGKILLSPMHCTPQSIINKFSFLYLSLFKFNLFVLIILLDLLLYTTSMSNFSNAMKLASSGLISHPLLV